MLYMIHIMFDIMSCHHYMSCIWGLGEGGSYVTPEAYCKEDVVAKCPVLRQ